MSAIVKSKHTYITHVKNTCGGRPIIKGTRTTVRSIAGYYNMGMPPEKIVKSLPHLNLARVHDALSYYYDHQEEIDQDIKAHSEKNLVKTCPDTI